MYGFAPFPPPPKHAKIWGLYLAGGIAIDLGLMLGLILFGGFALITMADDARQYLNARNSEHWTAVTGKINNSGTVPEGGRFGVVANYSYTAGGEDFIGDRVVFSARRPVVESEVDADQLLGPIGRHRKENEFSGLFDGIIAKRDRSVTVYFDPAKPWDSTLRREYRANPDLSGVWPVAPISAFVIAILIWSIRSWFRYIKNREYESAVRSRLPS